MVDWLFKCVVWTTLLVFKIFIAVARFVFAGLWYVSGVIKQRPLFIWVCLCVIAEMMGGYAKGFFEYQILGESLAFIGGFLALLFGMGNLIFVIVNWFRGRRESSC